MATARVLEKSILIVRGEFMEEFDEMMSIELTSPWLLYLMRTHRRTYPSSFKPYPWPKSRLIFGRLDNGLLVHPSRGG